MPQGFSFENLGGFEQFDPLATDDLAIDQESMDDGNPLDTVDFPTLRNMPEDMQRRGVYTPERQGGAKEALRSLMDHNPARQPILSAILTMCAGGEAASVVTEKIESLQKDNRSVYAPMTLCRMLERAGGLTLDMPETSREIEDVEQGVEYLEITDHVDPLWISTEAGLAIAEELSAGASFKDIVLKRDARYIKVYAAVMNAIATAPTTKGAVDELVDTFPVVAQPRRFGGHFIDILERTHAIEWKEGGWMLTDLGTRMLPLVNEGANHGE